MPAKLVQRLEGPPISVMLQALRDLGGTPASDELREMFPALLSEFTDVEVEAALGALGQSAPEADVGESNPGGTPGTAADSQGSLRPPEFEVLQRDLSHPDLMIRSADLGSYQPWIAEYFSRITLVDKLRETRAFTGFNRVYPDNSLGAADRRRLIQNAAKPASWLPAYLVFGEGLFFEFSPAVLTAWEELEPVRARVDVLNQRFKRVQEERGLQPRELTPRFVMIHTFAHLLMNRLTYECGYSSASLRERMYVAPDSMAGVLIYTAAGDAEGTMGGLVRMGKPGHLERAIEGALREATWCPADPVCMELGLRVGQGPDSCNMAACHNCALVPETACEEFNRFLDRGLVVGELSEPLTGAFSRLLIDTA